MILPELPKSPEPVVAIADRQALIRAVRLRLDTVTQRRDALLVAMGASSLIAQDPHVDDLRQAIALDWEREELTRLERELFTCRFVAPLHAHAMALLTVDAHGDMEDDTVRG